MSGSWLHTKERGTVFWLYVIRWICFTFGRRITRLFLYPICWYFFLVTPKSKAISRSYLNRVLDEKPTFIDVFKHHLTFSQVILDRAYFLDKQFGLFDVEISGVDLLLDKVANKEGCLLFGAHLGSFEALRALAIKYGDVPLKVMMYSNATKNIDYFYNKVAPEMKENVIEIGQVDSLLKVKEALEEGYLIGILNDRVMNDEKSIECDFLNGVAEFPTGPMLMAHLCKAPVLMSFCLYKGGNRYEVNFEKLSDEINLPRATRQEGLRELLQQYATRLEYYTRQAPLNWFNFYDYWKH